METTDTLPHHQRMFKLLGLIDIQIKLIEGNYGFISKIHNLLVIIIIFSTLLPSIAYFMANITDIAKTTDATYIIGAMSMALGMYCFLVNSKIELKQLLMDLQMIAGDSEFIFLWTFLFNLTRN